MARPHWWPYLCPLRPPSPRSCSTPSSAGLPGATLPQRTRHQRGCLGHCPDSATRHDARESATPTASCPCRHGIPDSGRRRLWGDRREFASLLRHSRGAAVGTGTVLVIALILDLLSTRHSQHQASRRVVTVRGEPPHSAGQNKVDLLARPWTRRHPRPSPVAMRRHDPGYVLTRVWAGAGGLRPWLGRGRVRDWLRGLDDRREGCSAPPQFRCKPLDVLAGVGGKKRHLGRH
jgi:hypothetical protein